MKAQKFYERVSFIMENDSKAHEEFEKEMLEKRYELIDSSYVNNGYNTELTFEKYHVVEVEDPYDNFKVKKF